ncbi:hypothetical protein VPH35_028610 [Triticum aestivum]
MSSRRRRTQIFSPSPLPSRPLPSSAITCAAASSSRSLFDSIYYELCQDYIPLWRCWTLHDDSIQSGKEPILNSALLLESYEEEWRSSRVELSTSSGKGTGYLSNPKPCISTNKCIQWTAPIDERSC